MDRSGPCTRTRSSARPAPLRSPAARRWPAPPGPHAGRSPDRRRSRAGCTPRCRAAPAGPPRPRDRRARRPTAAPPSRSTGRGVDRLAQRHPRVAAPGLQRQHFQPAVAGLPGHRHRAPRSRRCAPAKSGGLLAHPAASEPGSPGDLQVTGGVGGSQGIGEQLLGIRGGQPEIRLLAREQPGARGPRRCPRWRPRAAPALPVAPPAGRRHDGDRPAGSAPGCSGRAPRAPGRGRTRRRDRRPPATGLAALPRTDARSPSAPRRAARASRSGSIADPSTAARPQQVARPARSTRASTAAVNDAGTPCSPAASAAASPPRRTHDHRYARRCSRPDHRDRLSRARVSTAGSGSGPTSITSATSPQCGMNRGTFLGAYGRDHHERGRAGHAGSGGAAAPASRDRRGAGRRGTAAPGAAARSPSGSGIRTTAR